MIEKVNAKMFWSRIIMRRGSIYCAFRPFSALILTVIA
jgi:hypothetical protein